jgi:hypothetical protein
LGTKAYPSPLHYWLAGSEESNGEPVSKQPRSKLRGIQKYDFTKPNKAEASFGVSNP